MEQKSEKKLLATLIKKAGYFAGESASMFFLYQPKKPEKRKKN